MSATIIPFPARHRLDPKATREVFFKTMAAYDPDEDPSATYRKLFGEAAYARLRQGVEERRWEEVGNDYFAKHQHGPRRRSVHGLIQVVDLATLRQPRMTESARAWLDRARGGVS